MMEFLLDVSSDSGFIAPWDTAAYDVMRLDPMTQAQTDYESSESWLGYPMMPLIDLQTMQVIQADVWPPSEWEAAIQANLP